MKAQVSLILTMLLLMAGSATAATFVVPTDDEMVVKATAIAVGTMEGFYVQEVNGTIETVYEMRVERGLKGAVRKSELLRVVTLGGVIGERGLLVPGEARFAPGERVLLFLDTDRAGRWHVMDLTLGRFEFVTSTKGERLLVREMEDVVGWDRAGRTHKENVRREAGFLQFIEARAKNRAAATDYVVSASDVTIEPEPVDRFQAAANATAFPGWTYTDFVNSQPIRWPDTQETDPSRPRRRNMAEGVTFYKRSDQNIAGAADGGVSVIQGSLAAWTNEPNSLINFTYAGQIAKASTNHDATNVVEFNDPQGRISGSWTGAGTVGICFLSFSGSHTFLNRIWLNITDTDVVFQNGYPATNPSFASAMTHELGHGLGWRHSNENHLTGGACDPSAEECASAAIMSSSVSANYGYTLQPWDRNAAQSVYPDSAPTCTAPSISAQPTSRTITAGQSTTLTVTATGTATLTYQWFTGSSGSGTPISGATLSSLTVSPTSTTNYWVRVSNACGQVNSVTATVTVNPAPPTCTPPSITTQPTSRTITAGQSTTLTVGATGTATVTYQWYVGSSGNTASPVSGATSSSLTVTPTTTTSYWVRVANDCGSANSGTATVTVSAAARVADILWRNYTTGATQIWSMNANRTIARTVALPTVTNLNFNMEATGDFDRDGDTDIAWRNYSTGENTIWIMQGTTNVSFVYLPSVTDLNWKMRAAADFDGDGDADVLWRNQATGAVTVWVMNNTTYTGSFVYLPSVTDLNWQIAAAGDMDGDGDADVVWRNYTTGQNSIWVLNRMSLVSTVPLPTVVLGWSIGGAGDMDADGDTDIVWRNSAGDNTVWYMDKTTNIGWNYLPALTGNWQIEGVASFD